MANLRLRLETAKASETIKDENEIVSSGETKEEKEKESEVIELKERVVRLEFQLKAAQSKVSLIRYRYNLRLT